MYTNMHVVSLHFQNYQADFCNIKGKVRRLTYPITLQCYTHNEWQLGYALNIQNKLCKSILLCLAATKFGIQKCHISCNNTGENVPYDNMHTNTLCDNSLQFWKILCSSLRGVALNNC